jgi:hypothetical protein
MWCERNSIQVPEGWQGAGDGVALLVPNENLADPQPLSVKVRRNRQG